TTGVVARSVVIHADPDDPKPRPAGNSAKRVACGVIAAR
ncbi:MAG: superoxide dismutase family protein, partial [Rhodocyclaceae bacterium]